MTVIDGVPRSVRCGRWPRIALGTGLLATGLTGSAVAVPTGVTADPGLAVMAASVGGPQIEIVHRALATAPLTTAVCQAEFAIACYSPRQLETAYGLRPLFAKGLTGRGRTIAIVDSFGSPTIRTDLRRFDAAFHLPAPPALRILQPVGKVPSYHASNATRVNWAFETTLDVEYAHAMAPGARILLVETPVAETIGVQGFPAIVKAENYVVDHRLADVITQSFGAGERTFPSMRALRGLRGAFVNAAEHGITVLASSGDNGATDGSNLAGSTYFLRRTVGWPASDPLVTAVGGTQLHLSAGGATVNPPNVWNDTNRLGSPASGGGGTSIAFVRPSWQRGFGAAGTGRALPDVSLSAAVDGGAIVYFSFAGAGATGYTVVGGTSEASPLFSGIVAVADQAAGRDLGLLNPKLYSLEKAKAAGLPDVAIGNNTVSFRQGGADHTVPGFVATTGYDEASGLGTVDAAKLVPELAAP